MDADWHRRLYRNRMGAPVNSLPMQGSGNQSASASSFSRLQKLMIKRGEMIEKKADLLRGHQPTAVIERKLIAVTAEIIAEETRLEEEKVRLKEWDRRIAPKLQDLEYCGNTIARHARHIEATIRNLDARPAWETKARESLGQAEIELRTALAVVQMAQRRYDAMQVIAEAAE